MTLKKDTELLWFGAGDDNCQDLDIEGKDSDGVSLEDRHVFGGREHYWLRAIRSW